MFFSFYLFLFFLKTLLHFHRLPAPPIPNRSKLNPTPAWCQWCIKEFLAQRTPTLTPRFMLRATALRGKVVAGERQEVVLHRSNTAMGSGTVLRPERTRRAAGTAVRITFPVEWQDRGRQRPANRSATRWRRDATTSWTALMAATRGIAPCVSRGPFIVTATGQCAPVSHSSTHNIKGVRGCTRVCVRGRSHPVHAYFTHRGNGCCCFCFALFHNHSGLWSFRLGRVCMWHMTILEFKLALLWFFWFCCFSVEISPILQQCVTGTELRMRK